MWGPLVSNLLQFLGAACLFFEWLIAFRAPQIDVFSEGIVSDPADDARGAAFERAVAIRKRSRSWLSGVGYFLLGLGLALAACQAYQALPAP
jgi:hypothetical protein